MNDLLNDEAELRRLDWELQEATWKGDAEWMKKHLSPDFVLIDTRGNIIRLDDWLRDISTPGLAPYEPTEVVVRLYGNTGIVSARLLNEYTKPAERVETDLRYTDVWIKGEDGWKYVAAHASSISVKREALS